MCFSAIPQRRHVVGFSLAMALNSAARDWHGQQAHASTLGQSEYGASVAVVAEVITWPQPPHRLTRMLVEPVSRSETGSY